MGTDKVYKFIAVENETTRLINEKANQLFRKLRELDITGSDVDPYGKIYFQKHHVGKRLFFSLQSSADIIYKSLQITGKPLGDTCIIDYGAGLGTLFLLAGMVGFKAVYYNDYFSNWVINAQIICKKLDIHIEGFIEGDIDEVIAYRNEHNIEFDIVASRNVVEHIYNLRDFYQKLQKSNLTKVCYSTTTANYHNPAMLLKHRWYHNKVEKATYINQRREYINELKPDITDRDLLTLVQITRGRAFSDFTKAVDLYLDKKKVPPVEFLGSNTVDCKNGVWAENMLTKGNYFNIINTAGFEAAYTAGFWDTHYKYQIQNIFARFLNRVIKIVGKNGIWLSPFVNVVAIKK